MLTLADGAKLAYEVLGTKHIGKSQPIVLIGGMSSRRGDWERLALSLEKDRPGNLSLFPKKNWVHEAS